MLFVLLSALSEKGYKAVNIDKRYIVKMFNSNLSYANLNSLLISLKQKLTDEGFIGNGDKALFSVFDLISEKKGISSVSVKLQKNRLYLVNNVKHHYTGIDLLKLNSMPCFGAKVVYCWINQYKKVGSFFVKADKLLPILGVDTSDSCNLGIKFKRMIKALHSIGYEVEIIKEKKGIDARRISALRFNFKEINQNTTKQAKPTTPPKLKQDKPMISEIKTNQVVTNLPTPTKENDTLTRFKNSFKSLDISNHSPTIPPTIKKAENDDLAKYENIVLTSPKYFDYKIISVTKGSLYYEIKAYCDLKKKHDLIKLLVADYGNPLSYFFKQGYKFKEYQNNPTDVDFKKYVYKMVSLIHSDDKHGDIVSYLKIMRIFKRYDNKIQVELKDVDKEGVIIKPFIAENNAHLNAWFNKYQFGSY
ncbi:hypothetical protein [Helicobacter pylori]|uniref:hypothetical protein n=1 Tax=Helicobacter pylori TaxID=210 RepID=UPI0013F4B2BF